MEVSIEDDAVSVDWGDSLVEILITMIGKVDSIEDTGPLKEGGV